LTEVFVDDFDGPEPTASGNLDQLVLAAELWPKMGDGA